MRSCIGRAAEHLKVFDVRSQARRPVAIIAAEVVHASGREFFVIVLGVHHQTEGDLLHIRETGGLARLLPRLGKDREKNRGQDGDNSDNDEKFNKREAGAASPGDYLHRFPRFPL